MTSSVPANVLSWRDWAPLLDAAACEVFEMMLGCHLQSTEAPGCMKNNITAVVGLAGALRGSFSLRCSYQAAIAMTSAMLGAPIECTDQERWDAVGEVCNMVAGDFKARLKGIDDGCMLSVPTVVSGSDYTIRSLANGGLIQRAFSFQDQIILLSLEIFI